ncbi:hypothetical protein GCM10009117_05580 [Gangjinia marincola]|uniref:ThuA-like domain-containing protein n=1 Tax=Gangjinia marincola TaxID=578463 RepID=A0ABN1ME73_9FLAO
MNSVQATANTSIGNPPSDINQDWLALLLPTQANDDLSILIYHETNGFRHSSINVGIDMINEFGDDLGWTVSDSQNSSVFNSVNLKNTDVVVWLNTSGNDLRTGAEQDAFENFIQNGGGFVGVHPITDTYRDTSCPSYNNLVGEIAQTSTNHTSNNFNATMTVLTSRHTVDHLVDTWNEMKSIITGNSIEDIYLMVTLIC